MQYKVRALDQTFKSSTNLSLVRTKIYNRAHTIFVTLQQRKYKPFETMFLSLHALLGLVLVKKNIKIVLIKRCILKISNKI